MANMASTVNVDQDVDMLDIDGEFDFDDDELEALLEAHGLADEQPKPQSKWDDQQGPPPSAQREPGSDMGRKSSRWKGKGKAVDVDDEPDPIEDYFHEDDDDDDWPPPSAQHQPGPELAYKPDSKPGRDSGWKGKGKGKEKAYGKGDVLGLDHPTAVGGNPAQPGRGRNAAPGGRDLSTSHGTHSELRKEAPFGKGDVLGLDGPAVQGRDVSQAGRVDKVQSWLQSMDLDFDEDLDEENGDGDGDDERETEAAISGTPGRPKKVIGPSPSPEPSFGSSPPVMSGLSIRSKRNDEEESGRQAAPAPVPAAAAARKIASGVHRLEFVNQSKQNPNPPLNAGNQGNPINQSKAVPQWKTFREARLAEQAERRAQAQAESQAQTQAQAQAQAQPAEGDGKVAGHEDSKTAEAQPAEPDPYDSEVSIAARPIVSHDPDDDNRPIDLDVKATRGVVRYMLMNEKFPEVWPLPPKEPTGDNTRGATGVKIQNGKGVESGKGEDSGKGAGRKDGGLKDVDLEGAGEEGVGEDEGKTGKKEVVIPKGVVMLVTGIQYLKMPDETPSPSEIGSEEYEYYDDYSQEGSHPPSPGGGAAKGDNADDEEDFDVGLRGGGGDDDDYDMDNNDQLPPQIALEEVPETDLDDSDISMSNADYQLPPSSQIPPPPPSQLSRTSQKRTWSQRREHNSSNSSSRSVFSVDNHQGDPYYGLPPPHPPSGSSSNSQPPMGPPNLLIRILLYDGEFWVQALLRPEFHYLILGKDFDEWASEPEDDKEVAVGETAKSGAGTEGNAGKGKDGKPKTEAELAKEERAREEEMQTKWNKRWVKKARGDVREGSYVRLVGEVIVEFEEVEVEDVPQVRPQVVAAVSKMEAPRREVNMGPVVPKTKAPQYNYRGEKIGITDDGVGDPEKLEKLRKEAMEQKRPGNMMGADVGKPTEDGKPKTTRMICLIVGQMVPVGYDRKFIRELKKAEVKALEDELGPAPPVPTSPTASEKEKAKKKEPEEAQPWWVETEYRAELNRKEEQRLAEMRKREVEKQLAEFTRPDYDKILPPGWKDMTIWEVDAFIKEWEKKNKPKEPKPSKPPKPVSKPIITARQPPKFFRSSMTAQEIFQLQNPDRPPAKPRLEYEPTPLPSFKPRPAAIEVNQVYQRRILEMPRRREPRVQKQPDPQPQQQPGPQARPHLQPNPLLRPPQPRPQAQVQSRPQPYSVVQPVAQPQLRHQPQLQPQLLPHPTRPQFQPRKQPQPQSVQQQQRPQFLPQPQLPLLPPESPPKPNPHLATDPTIPLKLTTLQQIPHLPYPQNWMCNVLAIVVSNSDVEPCPFPPSYTQRIVRLADQSTTKHILLNVFLDAEDFNPKPGEVVLLMGVKNHKYEGGSLKKYHSDRPPEGKTRWKWWVREEVLLEIGWCRGLVEGLKGWWREKREREREKWMGMGKGKGREEGG